MYRFVTRLSVVLVLALAGQPVTAAVCQWACLPPAGGSGEDAGHHHHSTPPPEESGPSRAGDASTCDHQDSIGTAIAAGHFKLHAPAPASVMTVDSPAAGPTGLAGCSDLTHSPPGRRSPPSPLRI